MPNSVLKRASFKIKEIVNSGNVAIQYHMTGNALWIYTIGLREKSGNEVFAAFYVAPNTEIQTLEFAKDTFYKFLKHVSWPNTKNTYIRGTNPANPQPFSLSNSPISKEREFILIRPDIKPPVSMKDCSFYLFRVYDSVFPRYNGLDESIPMLQLICSDIFGVFPTHQMVSNDFYACNQILLNKKIMSGAFDNGIGEITKRNELFFKSVEKENAKLGLKSSRHQQ